MKINFVNNVQFRQEIDSSFIGTIEDDCGIGLLTASYPPLKLPVIFSLELTPACNNRCPGCSNIFIEDKSLRSLNMVNPINSSIDKWMNFLQQISSFASTVRLTGGEPTLYPHFYKIMNELNNLKLNFTVFTQGRWNEPDKFLSTIRNSPMCTGLLVSLHGANAQSHDYFTGRTGSFIETTNNIKLATSLGIRVNTNTVLNQKNIHQIEEITELTQDLGAEISVFNRYIGVPDSLNELSTSELEKGLLKIENLRLSGAKVKFGTCIPLCFANTSATGCLAGTAYCTIDPWGNVKPCNHAPLLAGNVFEKSLKELWMSKKMNKWRRLNTSGCQDCDLFNSCHGGCRAETLLKSTSKDPLMKDVINLNQTNSQKTSEKQFIWDIDTASTIYD